MKNKIENIRKTIEATEREWRELGFFYDFDSESSSWNIFGSKPSLEKFAKLFEEYSNNPKNNTLGEHDHFGPYMYLKVVTLESAEINNNFIGGSLSDLSNLSIIIRNKIAQAKIGDIIVIDKEYSNSNTAKIKIEIKNNDFDIIAMDEWIREKKEEINY